MTDPTDDDLLEERLRGYLERFTSYPQADGHAVDTSAVGLPRRRRRLAFVAAVAVAALCVTGTATAALVVTLRHDGAGTTTLGSTAVAPGHAIFIPLGGSSATSSAQGSTSGSLQGKFPAAAPLASSALDQSAGAFSGGGYSCGSSGSAQVTNGQIQVQGLASIGSSSGPTIEQLTVQVSGAGATNKAAVVDAQTREAAVFGAMTAVGVAGGEITVGPVQIGQNGYYPYSQGQSTAPPSASGDITVTSTDAVELGIAADAAAKAGGTQVYSYSAYGTQFTAPTSGDLATALSDATATAHDEAVAAASAAGLHLGKVSGLSSSPPTLCYGAGGERLVVAVTVNYSAS